MARALDVAARRWPDEPNRRRLLLRLLREGQRAAELQQRRRDGSRQEAVARTAGVLRGSYGEGYLRTLREDWPE